MLRNRRQLSRIVAFVLCCMLLAVSSHAATKRILVVGDSWAEGICRFKVFETVLASHGIKDVEIVGETTALGGSRADEWATNHKGKLDALTEALKANPTVDIVHLSIGGNDFLNAVIKENVCLIEPDKRTEIWARICKDMDKLIGHILGQRPGIRVLLNDYDYLDPALMREKHKLAIPEQVTAALLNKTLLEFARYKYDKFKDKARCGYINHFGLLQYYYGFPPDIPKETVPLPGDPPKYEPFAGGNPAYANSPEAMPDGVHPYPKGYEYIVDHCFKVYYEKWLKESLDGRTHPKSKTRSPARSVYNVADCGATGIAKERVF